MREFVVRLAWMFLLAGTLPFTAAAGEAPGTPLEIGRSLPFESRLLHERRILDVTLPEDYESSTADRYPVVFVLDSEFEHEAAACVTRFYARMAQLPPMIVVGIRNSNRTRDFSPAPIAGYRPPPEAGGAAGGAPAFLQFLETELIPYVDRNYRTAPMRVLVGHSLGGLFALYALAEKTELFNGYVVMEPSVWWNQGHEFEAARAALMKPPARRARVMLVNVQPAHLDTTTWGGTKPMVRQLATSGETHQSMAMAGMMLGLRTMFEDWKPAAWRPGTRPIAMLERCDSLTARIGYPVPIPASTYSKVVQMSVHSRDFDDAERVLQRMERELGASETTRELRAQLAAERAKPRPANWIPLEFPAQRPTAAAGRAFLGRWGSNDGPGKHEVQVRASADTIVVHDRIEFPNGQIYEADDPVIQVTADGTLEWGLPFFRGIAALLVLRGRVGSDGTMIVTREPRGWVPIQSGPDMELTQHFRRLQP
jgi:predicted alpha/beta superfamily hydrolase